MFVKTWSILLKLISICIFEENKLQNKNNYGRKYKMEKYICVQYEHKLHKKNHNFVETYIN